MLSLQGPAFQNPLQALGHVQPGTAQRSVEWHDPLRKQPADKRRRLMAGEIVQHQQHSQRGQLLSQSRLDGQALLPAFPGLTNPGLFHRVDGLYLSRWSGQDRRQFLLEPAVQNLVGGALHTLETYLPTGRMKQRQDFGRAVADVFVWVALGLSLRKPACTRAGNRGERPGLITAPDGESQFLAKGVSLFDQFFFAAASGSVTLTTPVLRLRSTSPVKHQERDFWQV